VPIWYQYAPGGEPWILTATGSRKTQLIGSTGHFSLIYLKPQHWLSADLSDR
jgi:hypothetical protein